MSGEGPNHEQRHIVVAFDGRTGKQLWVRDHYGLYGKNPVAFVAHFPSAVLDHDGDGADDWVVCSENFYGIISVKDNKEKRDRKTFDMWMACPVEVLHCWQVVGIFAEFPPALLAFALSRGIHLSPCLCRYSTP